MNEWIVPAFGGLLVLFGLGLMVAHVRSWRKQKQDPELDESERSHFFIRFRRRMQTSGMIAVLGVLVGAGDQLPILRKDPLLFTLYWIAVLLLTFWVMLLALGDYLTTRSHARSELARIQREQRELEKQLAELKRRGSNGQDVP